MIFETQDEVHAPLDFTFARFTDFIRYEPMARSYGADLRRVDGFTQVSRGVSWRGTVPVRGKTRGFKATVTEFERPSFAQMETEIGGMKVAVDLHFEALEDERTQVKLVANLKATTLAARLVIQSMKLARGRIKAKINSRLVALGSEFEDEYRREKARS